MQGFMLIFSKSFPWSIITPDLIHSLAMMLKVLPPLVKPTANTSASFSTSGCNLHPTPSVSSVSLSQWYPLTRTPGVSLVFCSVLDFPVGALPASNRRLHQPVINILNKPTDGWSLSPLERDVRRGQSNRANNATAASEWKPFFSPSSQENNLAQDTDRDVITFFSCRGDRLRDFRGVRYWRAVEFIPASILRNSNKMLWNSLRYQFLSLFTVTKMTEIHEKGEPEIL